MSVVRFLNVTHRLDDGDAVLVKVPGLGDCSSEDGEGHPFTLANEDGVLKLIVFADINSEEPTHTIDLSGAMESARTPPSFDEMMRAKGFHNCGLNADWNCSAYEVLPQIYMIDNEDGEFCCVCRVPLMHPVSYCVNTILRFDDAAEAVEFACKVRAENL